MMSGHREPTVGRLAKGLIFHCWLGNWEREELYWSRPPLRPHFTALHTPWPRAGAQKMFEHEWRGGAHSTQFPSFLAFCLLQAALGSPWSPGPWLPSCQVLLSDFPGCDPLSHLLPRALSSYPLCPIDVGRA